MAFLTRTTEIIWYLDSVIEVYITYDYSNFETFVDESLPSLRIANNTALFVLSKNTVLKQIFVNDVFLKSNSTIYIFHLVSIRNSFFWKLLKYKGSILSSSMVK